MAAAEGTAKSERIYEIDLAEYKPFFDKMRRKTYMRFLSPQLWYRQQRGLCPQNYRNWQKCMQQKGSEHVYCTYYRAISEGGCGEKFEKMWDEQIPHLEEYGDFATFSARW